MSVYMLCPRFATIAAAANEAASISRVQLSQASLGSKNQLLALGSYLSSLNVTDSSESTERLTNREART